jgi:hypothetical protein
VKRPGGETVAMSRRVSRDPVSSPDIRLLTEELRMKVRVTRELVDEINATTVALDMFRQMKRHYILDNPRSAHVD